MCECALLVFNSCTDIHESNNSYHFVGGGMREEHGGDEGDSRPWEQAWFELLSSHIPHI